MTTMNMPEVSTDESLRAMLANSVFYPNAFYDGKPIAMLSARYSSFVACDWNATPDTVREDMHRLKGYDVRSIEPVDLRTLIPADWQSAHTATRRRPTFPGPFDDMPADAFSIRWCLHVCWQRRPEYCPDHGREMIELFYFRGESTFVFEALYSRLGVNPAAIAIMQPGGGCGSTVWTTLEQPNGFFHAMVKRTSDRMPEVLLRGGQGHYAADDPACWPEYEPSGNAAQQFGEYHHRNVPGLPDEDGFMASVVEYRLRKPNNN